MFIEKIRVGLFTVGDTRMQSCLKPFLRNKLVDNRQARVLIGEAIVKKPILFHWISIFIDYGRDISNTWFMNQSGH